MSRTPTRLRALGLLALALSCAGSLAATCDEPTGPTDRWPAGAFLLADRAKLSRLLGSLEEMSGTPLARWSQHVAASLPDCPFVEGRAPSGDPADLWSSLRCAAANPGPASADQVRRGHDIAFALPAAGSRVIGFLDVADDGQVAFELSVPPEAADGALGLALPGSKSPGEPILSGSETLMHARVRPAGGLDLASWVPADSQGAQMFRLKSGLFAGAVLDGVWELAVYLPEEGRSMPRIAMSVGFALRRAAVGAMNDFVNELENSWPVSRSAFRVGDVAGVCLLELKLLPELAPCYVATESALIVGWNPASIRKALDGDTGAFGDQPQLHGNGGILVDLQRFAHADQILSRALETRTGTPAGGYPWSRVVVTGDVSSGGYRLRGQLLSAAPKSGSGT